MKSEHGKGNGGGGGGGADPDEPRHPVDLVFSKKKRKERGRVVNKMKMINCTSPHPPPPPPPLSLPPPPREKSLVASGNRSKAAMQQDPETKMMTAAKLASKKVRTLGMGAAAAAAAAGSTSSPARMISSPIAASASGNRPVEKPHFQPLNRGPPPNLGSGQWLMTPPVKKMRTDGGKRRPSHV
jgi:hypothetical protein